MCFGKKGEKLIQSVVIPMANEKELELNAISIDR